jgi:hypothetical protein
LCWGFDEEFTNEAANYGTFRVADFGGFGLRRSKGKYFQRHDLRPVLREGEFPRNDDEEA